VLRFSKADLTEILSLNPEPSGMTFQNGGESIHVFEVTPSFFNNFNSLF
jgi:hypothetical protein